MQAVTLATQPIQGVASAFEFGETLVKSVQGQIAEAEHERMTQCAETVLQRLCTADVAVPVGRAVYVRSFGFGNRAETAPSVA